MQISVSFFATRDEIDSWIAYQAHLKVWRSILRYSTGIAELHRKGLQLLPFAGGNQVFIDEPP